MNLHVGNKTNLCTHFLLPSINLPNNIYSWERLVYMGFINCYITDSNSNNVFPNCILLVFQPSMEIYENGQWSKLVEAFKYRENLVEIVEYPYRITGFWFKIEERFGQNLIIVFKKGKYSKFPDSYKKYLSGKYIQIVNKAKNYQEYLEKELNLKQGTLDDIELESIPQEKDLTLIKIT